MEPAGHARLPLCKSSELAHTGFIQDQHSNTSEGSHSKTSMEFIEVHRVRVSSAAHRPNEDQMNKDDISARQMDAPSSFFVCSVFFLLHFLPLKP
jgi:hypothetical protein